MLNNRLSPGRSSRQACLAVIAVFATQHVVCAQDLEPRRWSHQPVGTNVVGLGYAYTEGDLQFDPALQLEHVTVSSNKVVAAYSHWFQCFGKTARVDVSVPYEDATWEGLLSGAPASTGRQGFADPRIRLSYNFIGSPAMKGAQYMKYRAAHQTNTVVGAAVAVKLPLGEYSSEKLINLGQNRFVIRPQVGAVHTRGLWSYELTGSAFLYTDNDEFYGGNLYEQDSAYALQGHIVRSFPNRWWLSVSGGYSWGGKSVINGVSQGDDRSYVLSALSLGFPIAKMQALKFVYIRGDTKPQFGIDRNSLLISWTMRI